MPPRSPETNAIARPPRSDGKASRRPPAERVKFAVDKLLKGKLSGVEVTEALCQQFGIVERTAQYDIAEARLVIRDSLRENAPILATRKIDQLEEIVGEARDAADYSAAVSAIDKQLKIAGAYAPEKHEHTVLTDEDIENEIEIILGEASTGQLVAELEKRGVRVYEDAEVIDAG